MLTKRPTANPRLPVLAFGPFKNIRFNEITNALGRTIESLGDLFDFQFSLGVLEKPSSEPFFKLVLVKKYAPDPASFRESSGYSAKNDVIRKLPKRGQMLLEGWGVRKNFNRILGFWKRTDDPTELPQVESTTTRETHIFVSN